MRRLLPLALLLVALPSQAGRRKAAPPPPVEQVAADLLGRALASTEAWEELEVLCDEIGARLAGSPALERAIAWAQERMREDGLAGVRAEPVTVPVWVRGEEGARLLAPREAELPILGLGGSVATPDGGIEAEVLVVSSFEELDARKDEATGRIVLFDVPFTTYGETVPYRVVGADRASAHGAVAVLVRSVTTTSLSTPHTGALRYDDTVPRIPAAAVTLEAAASLHRLQERGVTPRVHLHMSARDAGEALSANVIGEVPGREKPEEIVLLACHLDSWDVGQGAQDDGAGCVAVMEAARLIGELPVAPRRTVRVVLYTNEENGLAGARAYHEAYAGKLDDHVAAFEMDTGSGAPLGFRVDVRRGASESAVTAARDEGLAWLARLEPLLRPLGATRLEPAFAGADIAPLVGDGVLGLGVLQDTSGYWPIHHTEADTLDKVDPALLARNVAVLAVAAYAIAEDPARPLPPQPAPTHP